MSDYKLTAKQEMFCREYLIDLNGTQAAIRAGYSVKTAGQIADENLKKPEIQSELNKLKAQREETLQINAAWVLKQAVEVHNRCMQEQAVTDKDGDIVGYKFDSAGAIKALELIGKHINIKAFDKTESHHHTGDFRLEVNFVKSPKEIDK